MTVKTPIQRGPSVATAMTIAVVSAIVAAAATVVVIKNDFSTLVEGLLAALALVAFGVTAYGLIQAVLALVDTAGERRRQDREVSERRQGDRARKPETP